MVTALMGLVASVALVLALRREVRVEALPSAFTLPATAEAEGPAFTVVVIVDFASAEARQMFREVTRGVAEDLRDAEIRLLHAPAGECKDARSFGCEAARALICAEVVATGPASAWLRLAGAAFDLQWEPEEERRYAALRARAHDLGFDVDALDGCVRGPGSLRQVQAQADLVRRFGYGGRVGGWVIHRRGVVTQAPFGPTVTVASLRWLGGCLAAPAMCEGHE